jgi:epoxyqueuosine reductase
MTPDELSVIIKEEARVCGFDLCGITGAGHLDAEAAHMSTWLGEGCNGEMAFLTRNSEKRSDASLLVPGAKTVIVVGLNYYSEPESVGSIWPVISRYASGRDYHLEVKQRLRAMLESLAAKVVGLEGRIFSDSAPLMEKPLAVRAGLGWQGKNSLLITSDRGSFFFLGEIVINLQAAFDKPFSTDLCGSCTKCIDACPTDAITAGGYVDARRCISYLTVELRGSIPEEFASKTGGMVYGCDICQDVCPHNRKSLPHSVPAFARSSALQAMTVMEWQSLTPSRFAEIFRESAVQRIGYERFMRNIRFSVATGPGSTEK